MSDVGPSPVDNISIVNHDRSASDPLSSEWLRYLASIAMTAVATVIAIGADSQAHIPNLSLVFVIPVVVAGASLGLGPSLCSAVLGAFAFNFFLTEPRYSLAVDDVANIWAIALLFVVGLIASGVAFTSHRRAIESELLNEQARIVQECSKDLLGAHDFDAVATIICRALKALFRVPAVVILVVDDKMTAIKQAGEITPDSAELEAAKSALATGSALRSGVYPNIASRFDFWPVQTTSTHKAVIGLAFHADERPAAPEVHVGTIANMGSLVIDRHYVGRR